MECASTNVDKNRLYLIKTVDATVSVCAPCTGVTLSTTSMNFNTHPLTVIATLMQDSRFCQDDLRSPTQVENGTHVQSACSIVSLKMWELFKSAN